MICSLCHTENPENATRCVCCKQNLAVLAPGFLLAGRYEILALVGKGGMGLVYKARDRALDDEVALKVLRPDIVTPEMAQRFRAEIRLARKVTHRNVCRIHEYGEDGEWRFISMAYVDGVDLKGLLRREGPLPPEAAFEAAIGVAEALEAIHEEGIVHRDLKTSNIMRDSKGIVKVMDFGIAKSVETKTSAGVTAAGCIVGTPEYMSPEQARGERVDRRSDLFSLGIVIFELFTGEVPFHAETPVGTLLKLIRAPAPLDASRLPVPLRPVLGQTLAKNPSERPQSAAEVVEALKQARALSRQALLTPVHPQAPILEAAVAEPMPEPTPTPVPAVTLAPLAVSPPEVERLAESTGAERAATVERPRRPFAAGLVLLVVSAFLIVVGSVVVILLRERRPSPLAVTGPAGSAAAVAMPTLAPASTGQQGVLKVVAIPWADVTVDGVPMAAFGRIPLAPGPHTVRLTHPEYEPFQRKLTIKAGEDYALTVDLPEEAVRKRR